MKEYFDYDSDSEYFGKNGRPNNQRDPKVIKDVVHYHTKRIIKDNPDLEFAKFPEKLLKKYNKYKKLEKKINSLEKNINKYVIDNDVLKEIHNNTIKLGNPKKKNKKEKQEEMEKMKKTLDESVKKLKKETVKKTIEKYKKDKQDEIIERSNKIESRLKRYIKLARNKIESVKDKQENSKKYKELKKEKKSLKEKIEAFEDVNFKKILEKIENSKKKITTIKSQINEKLEEYQKDKRDNCDDKSSKLKNKLTALVKAKAKAWKYVTSENKFSLDKINVRMVHGVSIASIRDFFLLILNFPKVLKKKVDEVNVKERFFKFIRCMQTKEQKNEGQIEKNAKRFIKAIKKEKGSEKIIERASIVLKQLNACPKNLTAGDPLINSKKGKEFDGHYMLVKGKGKCKLPKHSEKIKETFDKLPRLESASNMGEEQLIMFNDKKTIYKANIFM